MNQTAASYVDLQTSFVFYFIGEFYYRKFNIFAITIPVLNANIICDKYSNDLQSKFECYTNTFIQSMLFFFFSFALLTSYCIVKD